MQTILNYLESALIAVCLILIGVGALWAWGAYHNVKVSHATPVDSRDVRAARPVQTNVERDTTGEAWQPIHQGKDVDLRDKALAALEELDRQVKAQALTLEQARAEYSAFLKARKP